MVITKRQLMDTKIRWRVALSLSLSLILEAFSSYHPCVALLNSIKLLLVRPWRVRLQHTLREGNSCAD